MLLPLLASALPVLLGTNVPVPRALHASAVYLRLEVTQCQWLPVAAAARPLALRLALIPGRAEEVTAVPQPAPTTAGLAGCHWHPECIV
jgi:hypothetical protein